MPLPAQIGAKRLPRRVANLRIRGERGMRFPAQIGEVADEVREQFDVLRLILVAANEAKLARPRDRQGEAPMQLPRDGLPYCGILGNGDWYNSCRSMITRDVISDCIQLRRLDLFGSASRDDFDAQYSDLDFLVEFEDLEPTQYAQSYFALKEGLERLFERPVDLITENNFGNPYFRQRVQSERQNLYAQGDELLRSAVE